MKLTNYEFALIESAIIGAIQKAKRQLEKPEPWLSGPKALAMAKSEKEKLESALLKLRANHGENPED